MIITCDAACNMGYIYVQPPSKNYEDYYQNRGENQINKYIDFSLLHPPLEINFDRGNLLDVMQLSENTYASAVEIEFFPEYHNDLDAQGYIIGIELTLSKKKLLDFIRNGAFKVYKTKWRGRSYHVATFDFENKVFDLHNIIYPLSYKQDAKSTHPSRRYLKLNN